MNNLEKTKKLFENVRSSIVQAMQALYQVHESKEWEQIADNWGQYVEEELNISQSFASKLLTVNKVYLLGGVSQDKLSGIDYEKLYLARELEGSLEEKVEKARLLTRRELRQEKNDEEELPHDHIPVCLKCHIRL